jgi:hypothetical protein
MKQIDVFIPKELYDDFIQKHKSNKAAIDYLTIALENRITAQRYLIKRDLITQLNHTKITIPIKEHLVPYLNEYCLIKGITKQDLINKIMQKRRI